MRQLGAGGRENLALLALRLRCDSTGWTTDGLASLARWAGVSAQTMTRALAWLVEHRLVVQEKARPRHGGAQGAAWAWPRRSLRFEDWPEEVRALAGSSSREASTITTEPLSARRRGNHGASRNPDLAPDHFQTYRPFHNPRGPRGLHRIGERYGDVGALIGEDEDGICTTSTGKRFRSMEEWAAAVRNERSAYSGSVPRPQNGLRSRNTADASSNAPFAGSAHRYSQK